ncbi:unnamed protein product [Urochloa decumbens]|uniref:DUF1618 domain-containing protein n=1 Tax=Urochloa decumbens TaxID=240449 RepID=A0ABC8YIG7_9POAL
MAAPRRSPPIYVLNDSLDLDPPTGDPGQGFTMLECASKKAYGCGEHGQEMVDGLALYLRLGDAPLVTSSLAIRISDAALRRFDSELGPHNLDALHRERVSPRDREMDAVGRILVAEADLVAVALGFRRERSIIRNLTYFLVYDNVDASLSMINDLPHLYQGIGPLLPVPNRTIDGGACELLLMARRAPGLPAKKKKKEKLCVFSTATWAKNPACLWQIKRRRFPAGDLFTATMAFSFQGKGFWADLARGLVYCDLPHATGDSSAVNFGLIRLPAGCELDEDEALKLEEQPDNLTRIVGCGGGSIRFVCIDRATEYEYEEDHLVTMWTLQLPLKQWKEEWKFSARELWGFDGFKEAGLPKAQPEFPVVLADGGVCFVLTDYRQRRSFGDDVLVGHICSIDVPNKRVLWHGQVHDYPFSKAFVLPSSFFQRKQRGSHKRKFGDYHPTAGLASPAF